MLLLENIPAGRVFGLDQQTLIQIGIQLFNVSVLAFVMARLLYKPVRDFMSKRADRIKIQIEGAEDDMAKAGELKAKYEKKIKDISLERDEILDTARKLAAEKSKQLLAEAKNDADAIKARATQNIEMEQERVKEEMKQTIIEVSSAMAEKYITNAINKETHDKLFAEAMSELNEMTFFQPNLSDRTFVENSM